MTTLATDNIPPLLANHPRTKALLAYCTVTLSTGIFFMGATQSILYTFMFCLCTIVVLPQFFSIRQLPYIMALIVGIVGGGYLAHKNYGNIAINPYPHVYAHMEYTSHTKTISTIAVSSSDDQFTTFIDANIQQNDQLINGLVHITPIGYVNNTWTQPTWRNTLINYFQDQRTVIVRITGDNGKNILGTTDALTYPNFANYPSSPPLPSPPTNIEQLATNAVPLH